MLQDYPMSGSDPKSLNDRFALADQLRFTPGPGGLPIAAITNRHGSASVCIHGGHVTSYKPIGHDEVLWVSSLSKYQPGKAIRGGIPICWPWFADHPTQPEKPAHGVVRAMMWEVLDTRVVKEDQTQILLGISDNEQTREIWPHPFHLTVAVTLGPRLSVELVGIHRGDKEAVYGGALHSYFSIGSISDTVVRGLEGCTYIDKTDSFKHKTQQGVVRVTGEADWVFLDTTADCLIEDPLKKRCIRIAKSDSRSTVIWNPWSDKAAGMADFGNDEFRAMVCVEAANAGNDVVTLAPGQTHRMGTQISVEPFPPTKPAP